MKDFNSDEIIKVLDALVGKTEPCGSTEEDNKREVNLKNLIKITNWCLDGLNYSAEHLHSPAYSEYHNAEIAYNALCGIKEWLEDILNN